MGRRWWAGPGLGRAGPAGPTRPINFRYDGLRPGPAHKIPARPVKSSEDGPRPGPAHKIFRVLGRGPARPIKFSEDGPRPGPAHHIFKIPGPAHQFFKVSARPITWQRGL